jgi:hypothetical protein
MTIDPQYSFGFGEPSPCSRILRDGSVCGKASICGLIPEVGNKQKSRVLISPSVHDRCACGHPRGGHVAHGDSKCCDPRLPMHEV